MSLLHATALPRTSKRVDQDRADRRVSMEVLSSYISLCRSNSFCGGRPTLHTASILFAWGTIWDLMELASIPALILLNATFVAVEFALVSVRKTRVVGMVPA